jgi:membrane protease YdiL (CAAX protease family)
MDEPTNETRVISPRTLLLAGAGLGLVMVVLAVAWAALRGRDLSALFPAGGDAALAVGIFAGSVFAAAEWGIFRYTNLLHNDVARLEQVINLEALRWHHIAALVLLAAVPEELLFRGALMPDLGLLGTSVVFGLAHALSLQYFIYATLAGLFLGALSTHTGGLWAPIAAHAAIDAVILSLLVWCRPPGGWQVEGEQ